MKCERCGVEVEEGKTLCHQCENASVEEQTAPVTVEVPVEENPEGEAFVVAPLEETTEEPACFEENVEEAPAPKKGIRLWQLILAFLAGGIVLCGLGLLLLKGMDISFKKPENDVYCKESYSVSDSKLNRKADQVVATMGEKELTNSELQVFYWKGVEVQLSQSEDAFQSYGFDYTAPMDTQFLPNDEKTTWQMYFLEYALGDWQLYNRLALSAQEEGYTLDEDYQKLIDELPESLKTIAAEAGYASTKEMVEERLGSCCTEEQYITYLKDMLLAQAYYSYKYEGFFPDDAACEEYLAANEETLAQQGVSKDAGNIVNVRHILLQPAEAVVDEEGNAVTDEAGYPVFTEESWAKCKEDAEALLQQWLENNPSEESFAELANLYSEDPGSYTNGGLYSNVTKGQMVEAFDEWIMDEERVSGDYAIVQTAFGYHLMYYSDGAPYWQVVVSNTVLQERRDAFLVELEEKWPCQVTYKKIVLGDSDLTKPVNETLPMETEETTTP